MAYQKKFVVNNEIYIENLETPRLILRNWKREDIEPFALLNADPRVCEFLPNVITWEETLTSLDKIQYILEILGLDSCSRTSVYK